MLNRITTFLACMIVCLQVPWRIGAQPAWTVFNAANSGLPFDAVNCIAFGPGGMKWIGTEGGLACFDDTTWTVYHTGNSGIPGNEVRSLAIDPLGNKWIGTFLGGLAKFDGVAWTVYNTSNSALPDNHIKALAIDTAGHKWIGTVQGLLRFDDTTFTLYDLSNAPFELSDNISDIHIDTNNAFTIGTLNGGLIKIVDTAWTVYTIPNGSGIPDNTQLEVDIDHNGVEWMATPSNGLVAHPGGANWLVYNPFTSTMPSFGATSIELLTNPDRVWTGTDDKGVVRKMGASFTFFDNTNSPFPDTYATFVEADAAGMLWMGTMMGGLVRLDESLLTGIHEYARDEMLLYPTPATHIVYLRCGTRLPVRVELTDMAGRTIPAEISLTAPGLYAVEPGAIAYGMYLVHIQFSDGEAQTTRMIKSGR